MDIRALQKLGAGNRLKSVLLHLRITAGITEIKKNEIERVYGRVRIVCVLVCSRAFCLVVRGERVQQVVDNKI